MFNTQWVQARSYITRRSLTRFGKVILPLITILVAVAWSSGHLLFAQDSPAAGTVVDTTPTSIQITSIIVNLLVRISAIAAGVYIVKLGHQTLVAGIKGDFEFDGKWAKLKGSSPGLLFVLLGSLVIGWALNTTHSGQRTTQIQEVVEEPASPTINPADVHPVVPPPPGVSNQ